MDGGGGADAGTERPSRAAKHTSNLMAEQIRVGLGTE